MNSPVEAASGLVVGNVRVAGELKEGRHLNTGVFPVAHIDR